MVGAAVSAAVVNVEGWWSHDNLVAFLVMANFVVVVGNFIVAETVVEVATSDLTVRTWAMTGGGAGCVSGGRCGNCDGALTRGYFCLVRSMRIQQSCVSFITTS